MALLQLAGTSCTAYAPCGNQKGIQDSTILAFLAWCALRVLLQEPLILHENSDRFPIELLFRLLGHLYHIDSTIVEALKYGGGVRRKRRLTRLIHKGKVLSMDNPGFLRFDERFHRDCHMAWKAYYCQHLMDDSTSKARDNNSGMYTEQQWMNDTPLHYYTIGSVQGMKWIKLDHTSFIFAFYICLQLTPCLL